MQIPAAQTLHASLYRDPAVFETERRHVFGRNWLLFAHESQMDAPGAYVAQTIAGYPLIAVRGEDGKVRAFHNVCRHRAGPLADDGAGKCEKMLVCRYHGWRYALDGRLASARDFGPAAGFDPRDYALWPVACETWRGFIFVNLDKNAPPLIEFLKPLDEKTREIDLENFRFASHSTHEIRCNWKTYVENYLEGYHIPLIHPGLDGAVDSARYSVDVEPPAIFHRAPPRDGAPVAGLWAWLWPCLGINIYTGGLMMERMWPVGHERTRLDYLYFFPKDAPDDDVARAMASSEVTTVEDIYITEAVQRNLNAGIYDVGRLSPKHEGGVSWFQREIARALGN